jgi:hypothetical protein
MIRSNILAGSVREVISDGIDGIEEDVFIVNPSREAIRQLVSVLQGSSDARIRLFVAEQPLKDLMDDFLIASAVADLVDTGTLAVRILDSVPNSALLISNESVAALVEGTDQVAGLATTDDSFVASMYESYDQQWADAEEFSLRTPPLSTVMETLESDIGPDAAADFQAIIESLETAKGDGSGLDEVTISLLVAARNGELLYDISKWGEDIGLASKATFSRTKTRLEDGGIIDTEKVPIDVGRPRLRLMLGDEELQSTAPDELAALVGDRLD